MRQTGPCSVGRSEHIDGKADDPEGRSGMDTEFTSENLPINSSREDYAEEFARQYELYRDRDRSDPKGDWITWHTSVYDLAHRTLVLWSQEEYGTGFEFAVEQ